MCMRVKRFVLLFNARFSPYSFHSRLWSGVRYGVCGDAEALTLGRVHRLHRRRPAHLHPHVVSRSARRNITNTSGSQTPGVCLMFYFVNF